MSALDFKNGSEGVFALAKIVGMVVAAGWILYQWDVSLFPKERWDQSVRASAARVDLSLEDPSFRFGSLVHDETSDTELLETEASAREAEGTPTLISVQLPLKNDKPFPVQVSVSHASLRDALVPTSGGDLVWSESRDLDVADLLNISLDEKRIVETGSALTLSGQVVEPIAWCCETQGTKPVRMVEVLIELRLQGIDSTSSAPVEGAEKTRRLRFAALLTEEDSALKGPQFANLNQPISWAYQQPGSNSYQNWLDFNSGLQLPPT